jgi:hypothetical protein
LSAKGRHNQFLKCLRATIIQVPPDSAHGKKVKLYLYSLASVRGERSIARTLSDLDTIWDEWSESRCGCALPPGKDPRFPLDRRLGGLQSWSGHRG